MEWRILGFKNFERDWYAYFVPCGRRKRSASK